MSVIKPTLQCPELIAYFLGANNYCWVHFRNGDKKLLAKPVSYLERKLPSFIRVHKTVLLNPSYVKSVTNPPRQKMAGEIMLISGEVFPISRRRWPHVAESLQYYQEQKKGNSVAEDAPNNDPKGTQGIRETRSIFLISDDEQNALLAKRTIEQKWPAFRVHLRQQSSQLPELLSQLPAESMPVLCLLDARTMMLERFNSLQRLKNDAQLRSLPIILFVIPTDQAVADGYNQQANSVISMPIGSSAFVQTVEQVCQFWLRTVALPHSAP